MSLSQTYGGVIWTNHALDRLKQRKLEQHYALQAFKSPDSQARGKQSGTMEYQKRFGKSLVTVIASQNEKREWIILSCWVDPPIAGSMDAKKREEYLKYKRSGFWGKLWYGLKHALGY